MNLAIARLTSYGLSLLRPASSFKVCSAKSRCQASLLYLPPLNHSDATLRAAAFAMRHSSRMQESAAYDKGQGDRLVEAAVRAAESYAVSFG